MSSTAAIADVLIIGAGPAGLSACYALARQARTAVVFDTGSFRNHLSKHMHMVPTWDHRDAADFRAAARTELTARYGAYIRFVDEGVVSLTRGGPGPVAAAAAVAGLGAGSDGGNSGGKDGDRDGSRDGNKDGNSGGDSGGDTAGASSDSSHSAANANSTDTSNSNSNSTTTTTPNKQPQPLFTALTTSKHTYLARRLLLAHGIRDLPARAEAQFPGYTSCWTRGIFHCLFCHGFEERGAASAGVLAWGSMAAAGHAVGVGRMARNLVAAPVEGVDGGGSGGSCGSKSGKGGGGKVVIYTHGDEAVRKEIEAAGALGPRIEVDGRRIVRFEMRNKKGEHGEEMRKKGEKGEKEEKANEEDKYEEGSSSSSEVIVHFEDGSSKTEGFIAHMPSGELAAPFGKELGCEMASPVCFKVGAPFPETTVKGVFAAGDIASPAPSVMAALSSGQWAGVGLVQSLAADVKE